MMTAEVLVPEVKDIVGYDDHTPFTLKMLASHTSGLDREPVRASNFDRNGRVFSTVFH